MRKIYTSILLFVFLSVAWSCDKSSEDLYKLNVKPEVTVISGADIAFKAIGGNGYIEVGDLDGTLQATTSSSSWCHLTVEGKRIKVEVDEYTGLESRYAVVQMKSGEAEGKTIVHQFGIIVKEFSPTDVTLKNDAQDVAFYYDANGTLIEAESDAPWAQVIVESDSLRIRLSENGDYEYREAHIHWHIGEMKGDFSVSQFDLRQAGLLGYWTFYAVNASNGRAFSYYPLEAALDEATDGTYTLFLEKVSGNVKVDYTIKGVVMQKDRLMIPLGNHIGTHQPNASNLYQVFPVMAAGSAATTYANALTTGYYPLTVGKDETGQWQAVADPSEFGDLVFRFEFWEDKSHTGNSKSRTALRDIYMTKN